MKFMMSSISAIMMAAFQPAHAAPVGAGNITVHRLSDAQIAAIADAQALRMDAAPLGVADEPTTIALDEGASMPKRKVHGEFGFGIGSGGYSEIFGTVVTPLGENGVFAFTFAQQNGGHYNRYRRR